MGVIINVAQLALCQGCGMHGCLVFADGSKSESFISAEDAFSEVESAFIVGKIMEPEVDYLRKEIKKSNLISQSDLPAEIFQLAKALFLKSADGEQPENGHFDIFTQMNVPTGKRTLH